MIELKKGEKIISVHRRHIFIIILGLLPMALLALVVVGAAFFASYVIPESIASATPVVFLIMMIFVHMLWIISFIILADYYLDIWVLTDKRVITIEQKGLFSRKMSEFELDKIQEVSVDISGFFPTLLDYGNVRVRTASENPDFIFKQIGSPNEVKDRIMTECDKCRGVAKSDV